MAESMGFSPNQRQDHLPHHQQMASGGVVVSPPPPLGILTSDQRLQEALQAQSTTAVADFATLDNYGTWQISFVPQQQLTGGLEKKVGDVFLFFVCVEKDERVRTPCLLRSIVFYCIFVQIIKMFDICGQQKCQCTN